MKYAFIEAPISEGSPTEGSRFAFGALRDTVGSVFGTDALFLPCPKRDPDLSLSPKNLHSLGIVTDMSRRVCEAVSGQIGAGNLPIVIGGDHSVAMGSIAAAAETSPEPLTVVYIDGHTDINTEESTESGYIHGMPLAQAMGLCTPLLDIGKTRAHLRGENTYILGARSIDPGEYPILRAQGVHLYTAEDVRSLGIGEVMRRVCAEIAGKRVHISFDVDCMDGEVFPATGYRMPDGMTFEEALSALIGAFRAARVCSLDLVEYDPTLDHDGHCLALLSRLLTALRDAQ